MQCDEAYCSVLQYVAVYHRRVRVIINVSHKSQCVAVCCSVMQSDAVCCSAWQCTIGVLESSSMSLTSISVLQCVALCCRVMQCDAV